MENQIFKKENGEVKEINMLEEEFESIRLGTNPCSSCQEAYANKCPKIADELDKKNLRKYDFIKEGYQINNEKGELEHFIVSDCEKYKKDTPRRKRDTIDDIRDLTRLKESLMILFFNAGDLDEADNIQYNILAKKSKWK